MRSTELSNASAAGRLSVSRRLLFATITIFSSLAICLALAEVGLRLRERSVVSATHLLRLFAPNPQETGSYRLKPNLSERVKIGRETIRIRTNSQGMAWREVSVAKRPGTHRVAFVGDSFTFGCWARNMGAAMIGEVDEKIRAKNPRVEVLNFGVGGYGFDDEEILIKEVVLKYAPDTIVLCSFNGNDFRDTFFGVHKYDVSSGVARFRNESFTDLPPEIRPGYDSSVDQLAQTKPQPFWSGGSALWRLISSYFETRKPEARPAPSQFVAGPHFTEYTYWSRVPLPEWGEKGKKISMETLERIHAAAGAAGAKLMIVTVPFREQVFSLSESGSDYDIRYPQKYVEEFAAAHGIPYCDLLPAFRAFLKSDPRDPFLAGDIHFNDTGHALAGQTISDWLSQELAGAKSAGAGIQ